jgi:hypothetical protein
MALAEHRDREPGHPGWFHHDDQGFVRWSAFSSTLEGLLQADR